MNKKKKSQKIFLFSRTMHTSCDTADCACVRNKYVRSVPLLLAPSSRVKKHAAENVRFDRIQTRHYVMGPWYVNRETATDLLRNRLFSPLNIRDITYYRIYIIRSPKRARSLRIYNKKFFHYFIVLVRIVNIY